jgi:periplasmic divalent cation tolerance protein
MDTRIVWVTFPDRETARKIGTQLVESQLAACVNLVPGAESIYRWQGKVEQAQEVLAVFKIRSSDWQMFEARLKDLHPYEVPEIVAFSPTEIHQPYADWVREMTCR